MAVLVEKIMRGYRCLLVGVLLGAVPACASQRLPPDAVAILDGADTIELISLDPGKGKGKPDDDPADKAEKFHGYKVLGKTKLEDKADRGKVLGALYKGVRDSDGSAAACFIPRHGIRASHDGKTVELVICFQCLSMAVYIDGHSEKNVLTTSAPGGVFNEVLEAAGVALPKQPR